ncbi:LysR family transcriptional regulator [Pseudomaricurvus alkylphenolicus]|uniref:LysR substrate-binding domain-containing protein n=1 Tax=Pseudomaricurvus alkylphenolicus TaxID=1306991 RepID=UPI001421C36A|nr:LysR substrate-binding domain-containing protein [Pseudomaricurvus alkylphenolicus]NIB44357.1 LysR family transcriptional regulator [Pseudomaricurvus alkylphenolicus]
MDVLLLFISCLTKGKIALIDEFYLFIGESMFARLPSSSALKTFESAARLGSFKAAAEELAVSATAVSHQIRALEDQLGVALFVRKTRRIELTTAGDALAPILTRAFLDIRNALEVVVSEEAVIRVSTTPSFATLWLVPRLLDFYSKFPQYRLQLDTTTRAVNLKQDRHVDIAIRYGVSPHDGLDATPLFKETFGAYASPGLLEQGKPCGGYTLIETAWQQKILSDIGWLNWLGKAGLDIGEPSIVSFDEEEHVLQAAIAGKGLALASSVLVEDLLKRNLLIPYRGEIQQPGAGYTALCRPEQRQAPKVEAFLSWLTGENLAL